MAWDTNKNELPKPCRYPKVYFITSILLNAPCLICRQHRWVWGIQHQEPFSTKHNTCAIYILGKEKKKETQKSVFQPNCQADCFYKVAEHPRLPNHSQTHAVCNVMKWSKPLLDDEFMKCCNIWPAHGVLTISQIVPKMSQAAAIHGPNCTQKTCGQKRPLDAACGAKQVQEVKKVLALIALIELLWFRCWLKCCRMTWGIGWGSNAVLQLLLYAKALRGDTVDCGISSEVFCTGHCFHLSRVSWQSRQLQTSDPSFRNH